MDDFFTWYALAVVAMVFIVGYSVHLWRWLTDNDGREDRRGLRLMRASSENTPWRPQARQKKIEPRIAVKATIVRSTPKMLVLNFKARKNVYLETRLIHNLIIIGDEASFEIAHKYVISNRLI